MIKLIIFDLDGVLTSTKDLHFNSLNKALVDFGEDPISYQDHLVKFDGLSTFQKLEVLEKTKRLRNSTQIEYRKQEYTSAALETHIVKDSKFIELFRRLYEEGFALCIASNSIRYTTLMIPFQMGIMKYVNYVVSNQDVQYKKPHPEMYLQCMLNMKVGPRDTLIIEDSYVGRQGVFNSGAHLCPVNNPDEVTYDLIKQYIDRHNENKPKWKDNKMNILIPMAGAGSRFAQAGYTFPKPLIEVNGKPMIQVVIDNLNIDANYIFLILKEHYEKYNLKYMLEAIVPNCKIVQVDHLTEGAACTTLLAEKYIDNDDQLLIANSDQWVDWDSSAFMYAMQGKSVDGGILTFPNSHPKWSYAKTYDNSDFIVSVAEKKVISDKATVGIYHWKRGSDYVKYAKQMIAKNIRINGEFYVCPVFNEAIWAGLRIKNFGIEKMFGLGTPEDLNVFLQQGIK